MAKMLAKSMLGNHTPKHIFSGPGVLNFWPCINIDKKNRVFNFFNQKCVFGPVYGPNENFSKIGADLAIL